MSRDRAEYIDLHKQINEKATDSGILFLRMAILVNGGAAIAILGFVASVAKADETYTALVIGVSDALMYFAWGALSAIISIGLSYLTNYALMVRMAKEETPFENAMTWLKRIIHILAVAASLSSLFLFWLGASTVKQAIVVGLG